MNLFSYRKMEEDHYTNALMFILASNDYSLLPLFLDEIFLFSVDQFDYSHMGINLFSKLPPQTTKPHEYLIGIAPYDQSTQEANELKNNVDSIPDAWVYGENFTLLFEFKIRGVLDEAQLAAHQMKLKNIQNTLRLQWSDVIEALEAIKSHGNEIQQFLIEEFIESSETFKSKRRSSGMPKEIIGGRREEDELHFVITGSKETKGYTIDMVLPDEQINRLNSDISGVQAARRWIARYILEHKENLSPINLTKETIITDCCVKPGRSKDGWNQWKLGSYLK